MSALGRASWEEAYTEPQAGPGVVHPASGDDAARGVGQLGEGGSGAAPDAVGSWVRRSRTELAMPLRSLAARSGFSPSFISQVEHGMLSPSLVSMEKICNALGATLLECLTEIRRDKGDRIVRRPDRRRVSGGWSRAQIEALAPRAGFRLRPAAGSRLRPVVVSLDPEGRSAREPCVQTNEEFVFVLAGRVNLTLGAQEHELRPGDAVMIPAHEPRIWENRTPLEAKILVVCVG